MTQSTDSSELRRKLRAKMTAVLQCHKRWTAADASAKRAKEASDQATTAVTQMTLPATDDFNVVRDFLAERERVRAHWVDLYNAHISAFEVLQETLEAWHEVTTALAQTIAEAAECAELSTDDVLIAAQHLSQKAPPAVAPQPLSSTAIPTVILDPEQDRLWQELKDKVHAAALVVASAKLVHDDFTSTSSQVSRLYTPNVSEPVRPTEEEILRFLRGVEEAVTNRLKAHQHMAAVLEEREHRRDAIRQAQAELAAARDALVSVLPNAENVLPTGHTLSHARHLQSAADALWTALGEQFRWNVDSVRIPNATPRETRQLAEVRKLMRQAAIALANYNEANAAKRAAEAVAQESVSWDDALANTSWEDCLHWDDQKVADKEVVDRKNHARQTKIDLLVEQVTRYFRDVTDAKTALRRYHISITPHKSETPPCDELRAMINGASWIATPDRDRDETWKEGDYPVY